MRPFLIANKLTSGSRLSCRRLGLLLLVLVTVTVHHSGDASALSILDPSRIPGYQLVTSTAHHALDALHDALDQSLGLLRDTGNSVVESCVDCTPSMADPDVKRNVAEIIRSRGFQAEEYDVVTKDGYILTVQRIVNPLVKPEYRAKMKPVIMQHGLMSSSADWVINSVNVKPTLYPRASASAQRRLRRASSGADGEEAATNHLMDDNNNDDEPQRPLGKDSQEHPNSLGFYMANEGYDVFLANSRGNIYGQRHVHMSSWQPKFWDFSFDEQIKYDLPDVIEFVQKLTGHTKVGYVGHSQGTLMMFGLLSDRPEYADIVEPFVALAPVAYVNNTLSPAKYFAIYTPVFQSVNMWFATSNLAVKYLAPLVCEPMVVRRELCANLVFLGTGFNEEELDETRVAAYLNHVPSGTSVKNIGHYGQAVLNGNFAHFDYGMLGNMARYGQQRAPDYDLSKIRSKSMVLVIASNDWLAAPKDVARLRAALTVEPYAVFNMTEVKPKWNHIDYVYGKDAGELVNTRLLGVFEHFRDSDEH